MGFLGNGGERDGERERERERGDGVATCVGKLEIA